MRNFAEWIYFRIDEAKRKTPVAHADIEKWLRSIELLKRDLDELEKARKVAAEKFSKFVKGKTKKEDDKKKEVKEEEKVSE